MLPVPKLPHAAPALPGPDDVTWERPIFYARITLPGHDLHVINLHLKSRIPTTIPGQKIDNYTWRTVPGWAEGFFLLRELRVAEQRSAG